MKSLRRIAVTSVLGLLAPLVYTGTASAQTGGSASSILSDISVRLLVIIDSLLGYFVSGNTLTEPKGEDLVGAFAGIASNLADFLAQFSTLLTGNSAL